MEIILTNTFILLMMNKEFISTSFLGPHKALQGEHNCHHNFTDVETEVTEANQCAQLAGVQ